MHARFMPLQNLTLSDRGLFSALHVPPSHSGVVSHITRATTWLSAANQSWDKPQYRAWLAVAHALLNDIRQVAQQQPDLAASWFQPASSNNGSADRICNWPRSVAPGPKEVRINALLGHATIVEAHRNGQIARALIDGAHTLRNASLKPGRQSPLWIELVEIDFLNPAILVDFIKTKGPDTPCYAFVIAAVSVLQLPPPAPSHLDPGHPVSEPDRNKKHTEARPPKDNLRDLDNSPIEEEQDANSINTTPDIATRIAGADYASVAAKLGLIDRDYLPPDELARVSKNLAVHLEGTDTQKSLLALFGLTSLLTGCVDSIAVNLKFFACDSIWIDLQAGAWCWDFRPYRSIVDDQKQSTSPSEPIAIQLPELVASHLRDMKEQFPSAETLGQLFTAAMGSELDMRAFRMFLKSCGSDVHPIYRGRFARSLGFTYLQVTRSDMSCALQAGSFAAAAPAALFYFGPKAYLLYERTQSVYKFLGLGKPVPPANPESRLGCQKLIEEEQLKIGWQSLCKSISERLAQLRSSDSDWERRKTANQLMPLLCSAFVVQSAHRGTRIERITFGYIFVFEDAMLIMDKVDQEREQPRLVAKTDAIQHIAGIAWECHRLIGPTLGNKMSHDVPLFKTWPLDPKAGESGSLTTADIAPVICAHFCGADTNFARSTWVTSLDEAECDRWLIRVLTGHTRDVTRTNGAYIDIPVIEAARRLRVEMERVGTCIFGPTHLAACGAPPYVDMRASPIAVIYAMPGDRVPDPRTLLEPLDVKTLFGWKVTSEVRTAIFSGEIRTTSSALALLQMMFVDFAPDVELCISAILNPTVSLHRHGLWTGLVWHRPHFSHQTWIPLEQTTARTLLLARKESYSIEQIRGQACAALRDIHPGYWPQLPEACAQVMQNAVAQYMRMEDPPSLLAANSLQTPAPTLSSLSLSRLARDQTPLNSVDSPERLTKPISSYRARSQKAVGLQPLKQILFLFADTTVRKGELRKRSKDCLDSISLKFKPQTFFEVWLLDWVVDELHQSAREVDGRLVFSSLYTYLGVLIAETKVGKQYHLTSDPYEWEQEEWMQWTTQLLEAFGFPSADNLLPEAIDTSPGPLPDRIRHPLMRLIGSLHRRDYTVPSNICSWIFQRNDPVVTGSASSVLITDEDFERGIQIGESWLNQHPLDAALLTCRARIQHEVPTRSAELSNLKIECFTDSNQLVIERVGYLNLKTVLSVRLSFISQDLKSHIANTSQTVLAHVPSANFLLRLDGSPASGARDQELISVLSAALKVATGDTNCRPHALRAMALQNLAWPGWVERVQLLLTTCASPAASADWVRSQLSDWYVLSFAFVQAGHSDLRSALGNYLAGARLVLWMHGHAKLSTLAFGPSFLDSIGVNPSSLRQARRRGGADFDPWAWLQGHLCNTDKLPLVEMCGSTLATPMRMVAVPADSSQNAAPRVSKKSPSAHEKASDSLPSIADGKSTSNAEGGVDRQVHFLAARFLDMTFPAAMEYSGTDLATANLLEALIPGVELLAMVARRSRSAPQLRGLQGNLKVLGSSLGSNIMYWLKGLTGRDRLTLFNLLFKVHGTQITSEVMLELLNGLTMNIPDELAVHICRGSRHVTPAEIRIFQSSEQKLVLTTSEDIGAAPLLKLILRARENRVMASRLTSVLRALVLALSYLDKRVVRHD